jgi:hypothetical protein
MQRLLPRNDLAFGQVASLAQSQSEWRASMNKSRDPDQSKQQRQILDNEDEKMNCAMQMLERDNRYLKDLVVSLSATIVRLVTGRK